MSEWKEYKLGEIADLVKDKYLPKEGDTLNYVGLEHIQEQALRLNSIGCSDDVISAKFKFKKGDILFGKLRPYFRKVIRPNFDGVCSTDIWVIRAKRGINQEYLFYLFASKGFVDLCSYGEAGTRMPRADWNFMSQTVWNIPVDQSEQRAIASVLSSLDDKIDLLHRENKTLEAMAETLFRQWFIEEAKDEWEEVPLSEVTKIAIGRTPPRKESHWFSTDPKNVKWVSIKDLGQSEVFVFDTSEYLTQEAVENFNIPIIPADTVLLSFKMTVGRVGITTEPMVSNEAIAHFKFDDNTPFSKEYLYIFLKRFKYESLGSTSSIVTAINSSMIKDIEIIIPDDITMNVFRTYTEPLFSKIKANIYQIHTLEKLRDTLLPKLMSGEVRVKYEEEEIASCRA